MNRNEIIGRLNAFPFPREAYWVITGSAMVLYGIREETADLDLGCTAEMADRLEAEGYLYRRTEDGKRWFRYGDSIEIFEEWLRDSTLLLEGFRVVTLEGLLTMKRELGREKDLRDIESILAFLIQQKTVGQKKSLLVKDTTRAERERIVAESVGSVDGLCDGCSPGLLRMYEDYIEGRKELREINAEFRARYMSGAAGPDKSGCVYVE